MLSFLRFFKNSIAVLWKRHHLIVPPKYWGRYFKFLKNKICNKYEYFNPFVSKEYNKWLELHDKNSEIIELKYKPLISFIIPVYNIEPDFLSDCLNSILNQSYQNFEICLADDNSTLEETINTLKKYEKKDLRIKVTYRTENGHISKATNTALEMATGDYVALMDDDDILTSDALYKVVLAINENRNIEFIYSDEDKQDMDGNLCEPHFKSDFAATSLYGGNYICHFTVIKKSLLDKIGGLKEEYVGAQDFDLFLRATESTKEIYHISEVLYHWRKVPGSTADTIGNKTYAIDNGKKAVMASLERKGKDAYVTTPIKTTHYVVHYNVINNPLVSIILTNNNKKSIINNVHQFMENNKYRNIEIIVNSKNDYNLKFENVIFMPGNINNVIKSSSGEYVMIVSGKISIGDSNLIEEMLGYAMQDEMGVVGPKIYNYGKTIKSAGLILSNENIYIDAFANYFTDSYGVYGRLLVPYNYSAISDICIMFSKDKYNLVNGFRNDVTFTLSSIDFCLKLLKKGYQNVLLSHVWIFQKDNKRIERYELSEQEKNLIRKDWNLDDDIYYNKNFSKSYGFMLGVNNSEK